MWQIANVYASIKHVTIVHCVALDSAELEAQQPPKQPPRKANT